MKQSIVYSQPNCVACNTAKQLLQAADYEVVERKIGDGFWTKEDLFRDFPGARSVPQISIGGVSIGGLPELRKYLLAQ